MKIIIAPDKFKSSLSSMELCDIIEAALVPYGHDMVKLPLSDGGDGLLEVVSYYGEYEDVELKVHDPLFRKINSKYSLSKNGKKAIIEMAVTSGLHLLKGEEANCMNTTTYGVGELMLHAMQHGVEEIILGIGGSATNDCGMGMAAALGYRFLNKNGKEIKPIGKNLLDVMFIDASSLKFNTNKVKIKVACDVENVLYGDNGAAYIYGGQKGADEIEIAFLDKALQSFSKIVLEQLGKDVANIKGSGAAGGMGAGCMAFLGADLVSGIDMVFTVSRLEEHVRDADLIIFGEGKIDQQSFMGKVLHGLYNLSVKYGADLAVFCGKYDLHTTFLSEKQILFMGDIISLAHNERDSFKHASEYVSQLVREFAKSYIKFRTQ